MPVGEDDRDETAHGMARDDRPRHPDGVEQQFQIVRVHGETGGSCHVVASSASAQIGGDNAHVGNTRRDPRPRQVGRGDPVHGEDRRRLGGGTSRLPHRRAQSAAGHRDVDGAVRLHAHRAVHPPSMVYDAPVTMPASGPASHAASEATSSGSMRRFTADSVSMIFSTTSDSSIP